MGKISDVIDELSAEKNIPRDAVMDCFKKALLAGYRDSLYKNEGAGKDTKKKDKTQEVKAELVMQGNRLVLEIEKTVVKKPEYLLKEISLKDAKKINKETDVGELITVEIDYADFPLTSVAVIKNSFTSEIKNYIGNKIYDEFKRKEGTIIQGKVHRISKREVFVYLEDQGVEALLPAEEQSSIDSIRINETKKFLIKSVKRDVDKPVEEKETEKKRNQKDAPRIILSRADPRFIIKLLEAEVEELGRNEVEIKGIAREVGYKTKVAVVSHNPNKDAVGTFLGQKSYRIQNVRREIGDEVIEVIPYVDDPDEFIKNALNVPKFGEGKVIRIKEDKEERRCIFVVADEATKDKVVGKSGINVKLAYKLSGWKIDVKTEEEFKNSEISKLIPDKVENLFSGGKKQAVMVENEIIEEVEEEASIDALEEHLGRSIIIKLIESGVDTIEKLIDWDNSGRLKNITSLSTEELFKIRRFIEENIEIQDEEEGGNEEEEEYVICPNCGKEIGVNDESCPYCGIKLE